MRPQHLPPAKARGGRPAAALTTLALVAAFWPASAATESLRRAGAGEPIAETAALPLHALKLIDPGRVLLVDDDNNDPDTRAAYSDVLDSLAVDYDVWDTMNSDAMEPDAADLAAYGAVVWFTGAAFTDPPPGFAGPGDAGEAALASYLDAGGCFLLSSQDYIFDHASEGLTPFMTGRLGLEDVDEDVEFLLSVTGAGPFAGIGPSLLDYSPDDDGLENFSDLLVPDAPAEPAFLDDGATSSLSDVAAITRAKGAARASFWSFPFETLPPGDREPAMSAFFDWCASKVLEVTLAGAGSGTVTSSPAGVDCGADCSQTYAPGTEVTLTATPGAGSTFAGWSGGGCSGTDPCVVALDDDTAVTAAFDGEPGSDPTLSVAKTGSGAGTVTSSPAGIDCGEDCIETYAAGTEVTLTATPDAASTFAGWSGGGCSGTDPCVVTLDEDTAVTAAFDAIPEPTLTVSRSGNGSGTVTSSPAGIDCGSDCAESYPPGTQVSLVAAADPGSRFAGWSGGCSGTGSCVVTLDADTAVDAAFVIDVRPARLTVARTGPGAGTVTSSPAGIQCGRDCSGIYPRGLRITLTATAFPGSFFAGWSGGGCSGTGTCEITLDGDTSVAAAFATEGPQPALTASRSGTGTGKVTSSPAGIDCGLDCAETYPAGTPVVLTATADPGSTFGGWRGDCGGGESCAVTLDRARAVRAIFTARGPSPTLTANRAGSGTGTVVSAPAGILCGSDCSQSYPPNTVVRLTAVAATGSSFTGWGGDCGGLTCDVTLSTFNQSVTAIFDDGGEACSGALCLGGDRFQVDVAWRTPQGETGAGTAVPFRSEDSGLLWFFTENNWEMLVKVLDGCSLTRHFWVFAAAATDVEHTLTVTDTVTGRAKSYFNPQGNAAATITDTDALAVCDAPKSTASAGVHSIAKSVTATDELVQQGGCVAGPTTLCLVQGRFEVEVDWRTTAGGSGPGQVVPLSVTDSGLFYFFTANNWEMLVKVLDQCSASGHFWVFATAVTDTGHTLKVTDTETGQVKEYVHPPGQTARTITDVEAFATCP